jgi:hypothetical protein
MTRWCRQGTNPRALGLNPRAPGTNQRAKGTNPRESAMRKDTKVAAAVVTDSLLEPAGWGGDLIGRSDWEVLPDPAEDLIKRRRERWRIRSKRYRERKRRRRLRALKAASTDKKERPVTDTSAPNNLGGPASPTPVRAAR